CGKYRVFAVFLVCAAMLIAAFAISAVWMERGGADWLGGVLGDDGDTSNATPETNGGEIDSEDDTAGDTESESEVEPDAVFPEGATPIATLDLSALSLGTEYIHNETPYEANINALLSTSVATRKQSDKPLVLILHTHTSEAYLPKGTLYVEGNIGDATYSRDMARNILSVGEVLCDTLNKKGITAIHCAVMHDDPTLSGSYLRAAETVKAYLQMYPSIEYVIDLHRDAVTTSDGAFVRAVTEYDGEEVAQVMAVVGTDCNGTAHENWSGNLALALQLRSALNQGGEALCRPVSLRNSSYNQELAKYALILEIGTAANSVEEAKRAATLVGEALSELIYER
ncbi:MAG: stage II sporulation protein P, partial [Clostridia bacterium]|nr:stage II sporulation protein P [Clostridia bacterium]